MCFVLRTAYGLGVKLVAHQNVKRNVDTIERPKSIMEKNKNKHFYLWLDHI